jgi:hypothetical protein
MSLDTLPELLHQKQLTIIATPAPGDADAALVHDTLAHKAVVTGRADLEDLFCRLLAAAAVQKTVTPKTLDLVGPAVGPTQLLALGSWVIDGSSAIVTSYFRELAEQDVLPRLGIHTIRLIGSLTAETGVGQWTVCALSDILGVEVHGARNLLFAEHFTPAGFAAPRLLVASSDLRSTREAPSNQPLLTGIPATRALDVDSLPAVDLGTLGAAPHPRKVATAVSSRALLSHVRRASATTMPGLLLAPTAEVLLPSGNAGAYHSLEIVLDGTYVKVRGEGGPYYYGVDKPRDLVTLVDALS